VERAITAKKMEFTACEKTQPNIHRWGIHGGQSQYVRVPFADINCLHVPQEIADDKALYLSEIVPAAYHGTELVGLKKGSTVAIWGLGAVGLLAVRWCQLKFARQIIGIDSVPERLAIAQKELGIETINFKEKDVCKTLLETFPGGVDSGIECVRHADERTLTCERDTADILYEMIACVRKGGHIGVIGSYSGLANRFPLGDMTEKGIAISGSQCPTQRYWKYCLEMMVSNEIDPSFVITHRASLSQGPELYEILNERKDGIVKVFLRP